MSAVDVLLAHLERVRSGGDGRWVASCPTALHPRGDRSAGLGIRQIDDCLLFRCPAGFTAAEIVAAVGSRSRICSSNRQRAALFARRFAHRRGRS